MAEWRRNAKVTLEVEVENATEPEIQRVMDNLEEAVGKMDGSIPEVNILLDDCSFEYR